MRSAFLLAMFLAACGRQASQPVNEAETAILPAKPATPALKAFVYEEKTDLIDFHFAWSAEAAAVPQLVDRFRKEMAKARSGLLAGAEDDKAFREKQGFDFNGYMSSTEYKTAGQSDRLLSLTVEVGSYEGGAHGNYGEGALLWDRAATKEIDVADLFAAAANMDRLLTQPWCDALNKAREEKRGEPVGGGGMFDECPKLNEIAIIPTDKNRDGKFERLELAASPYVAGPWVEGSYEVELPVTAELIAAIRSDFRDNFATQPQ